MHQANVVPAPAETPHEAMDSVADWAADHPLTRADTRRPFIPQGCDQQGRQAPTKPLERPLASANATDPADDFRNADTVFWVYVLVGLACWASGVVIALLRPAP